MTIKYEVLEVGQIYKNYKTLCGALGVKIKTGKSKQLQIVDWERYFQYEKAGYSFVIKEIYETPKVKPELNNAIKYIDKIEKLILDLLVQEDNDGQVFLSKNKLLKALKMINENYTFGKSKPFKLSKLINIPTEEINEFYETSDGLFKRNLEASLNNLQDQSLISWKSSFTVCHIEIDMVANYKAEIKATKVESKDENGDDEVNFGIHNPNQKSVHRKATIEEEQLILRAQREVLIKYGCSTVSEIFRQCKGDIFYKEVREILFDISNIYLYYNSYEIISNKDILIKEWEIKEKELMQSELNTDVVDKLNVNAENRHKNSFKKYEEKGSMKYEMRMSESYIGNSSKLTDTLIQKDAMTIRYL